MFEALIESEREVKANRATLAVMDMDQQTLLAELCSGDSGDDPVPWWRGTHDAEASSSGKGEAVINISSNKD